MDCEAEKSVALGIPSVNMIAVKQHKVGDRLQEVVLDGRLALCPFYLYTLFCLPSDG